MAILDSVPRQNTAAIMAWKSGVSKRFGGSQCEPCSFAWPLRNPHFWNIQDSCSEQGCFRRAWRFFFFFFKDAANTAV